MNVTVITGRLTDNITLRKTQSGKAVTSFTVAVNRRYDKDKTDFINCVAWGKTAEFMSNYLSKGLLIAVHGEIQTRNYDDVDGKRVYVTEVIANNVEALEWKKEEQSQDVNTTFEPQQDEGIVIDIHPDDLPF
jgi:single-strand DNA-binding protein